MNHRVFIPLQPPSLNDILPGPKGQRIHALRNVKNKWARWIPPIVLSKKAKGKVRLTVTRFYAGRQQLMDKDNLRGGMKPIIDLFCKAGYMVDDSPQWLEADYPQVRVEPGSAGTLFEFEDFSSCESASEECPGKHS